ncbi:MAG: bifunctional folylpolyglutamate synthase/dihydrofolate synthase [Anaerolineae bacterium CG17_big_fil_post_rev_8_21_14_2_50_57_27]|nr:MAG: bifunctional folylpolyglutamate synthase/dihydrofolate synthase [Anaerolineae bacterium CG17_big_fil_post_rev_8_21_14_2_50_57_27]
MLSLMEPETAYNKALDYLYSFVDYSLKHTSELVKAEFDLGRMFELMAALGNPQDSYPILHVAGTKGKGSVAAMAASALHAAGYRAGLYISPHLQDFCERIQVDGEPIPHGELAALVEEIKPAVARLPFITTFELTTALGFLYFAQRGVEAVVIEVGLGGRLDATNIITPRVSVITSLSYDHMAVLGNTLAQIAGEKAGIIKEGAPVVSSPQKEEALAVIQKVAAERNAPLTLVGRDVTFEASEHSLDGQSLAINPSLVTRHSSLVTPESVILRIPLLGAHQLVNAATAYAALKTSGLNVSDEAIQKGFAEAKWPGRFEVLRREPPVILDSAHNVDSAQKLRQALDDYFPKRPVILIFGASEDKDVLGMFAEWKPRLGRILTTKAVHPRALEAEQLLGLAQQAGVPAEAVTPVEAALARALELSAKDGSIVLSAGSMFVTAEVRTAWQNYVDRL